MAKRDWRAALEKVQREGKCRVCGSRVRVEFAHLTGRKFDPLFGRHTNTPYLYVRPESGIPLCGPATDVTTCHGKQHAGRLDLLPYLTNEEAASAVLDVGLYRAYHKLKGPS